MYLRIVGAFALASACATVTQAQTTAPPPDCEVHVYPAEGVHSVGEDLDAVHRVDQDLRHYYENAGHSLNWLTSSRQLTLLGDIPLTELVGAADGSTILHPEVLSRRQALEPGMHEAAGTCVIEIMLPQVMLERGGLATRSLRLFGVVRRYENASLVRGYSGFAAAPMAGFQLRTPADAPGATVIVEQAYRQAVEILLQNAAKTPRK